MNILYMGYFCNEQLFNTMVENGSQGSHARQQLESNLLNGLIAQIGDNKIEMISYLPEILSIKKEIGNIEVYRDIKINYLWCNKKSIFSVLKTILKNIKYILSWKRAGKKNDKLILMYSSNPLHVIPAFLIRVFCKIKIITICSEVSSLRRTNNAGMISKISYKISGFFDNNFDGYIVLTKYMNELVNRKDRPYLVMEGIARSTEFTVEENFTIEQSRAILYAGGLTADNGIEILLESFVQLNKTDLELWICGSGPLEDLVRTYSKKNKNIIFYGLISNEEVRKLEYKAMLLINPRYSNNEFTKYSFPSKILEYLSIGVPTIVTPLRGIPEEYFEHVYILEDESTEGLKELFQSILAIDIEKRREMGEKAKCFVSVNKNENIQAKRVIAFLNTFH